MNKRQRKKYAQYRDRKTVMSIRHHTRRINQILRRLAAYCPGFYFPNQVKNEQERT